jgi:integrase
MKKPRPVLTDDNIRRVLAVSRDQTDPRAAPAVSLALSQGLTVSQLRRLRWPDMNLQAGTMLVLPSSGASP